ncbi:MAG TPA: flagellin [bacterium]|nr:flagellin [bacterium]
MSLTRINTGADSIVALNGLRKINNSLSTSLERISSGLRINKAADDPTGVGTLNTAKAQLGGIRAAQMNLEQTYSMLSQADGALASVGEALVKMKELAIKGANDATLTSAQIASLGNEYNDLATLIDNIGANTKFGEKGLLDGTGDLGNATIQVGADSADNMSGLDLIGLGAATALDFTELSGTAATAFVDASEALTELGLVDLAVTQLGALRANVGQYMNLLSNNLEHQMAMEVNVASSVSTIGDADLAAEISNMARDSILAQSATAALMQSNIQSQIVLKLLQ